MVKWANGFVSSARRRSNWKRTLESNCSLVQKLSPSSPSTSAMPLPEDPLHSSRFSFFWKKQRMIGIFSPYNSLVPVIRYFKFIESFRVGWIIEIKLNVIHPLGRICCSFRRSRWHIDVGGDDTSACVSAPAGFHDNYSIRPIGFFVPFQSASDISQVLNQRLN